MVLIIPRMEDNVYLRISPNILTFHSLQPDEMYSRCTFYLPNVEMTAMSAKMINIWSFSKETSKADASAFLNPLFCTCLDSMGRNVMPSSTPMRTSPAWIRMVCGQSNWWRKVRIKTGKMQTPNPEPQGATHTAMGRHLLKYRVTHTCDVRYMKEKPKPGNKMEDYVQALNVQWL